MGEAAAALKKKIAREKKAAKHSLPPSVLALLRSSVPPSKVGSSGVPKGASSISASGTVHSTKLKTSFKTSWIKYIGSLDTVLTPNVYHNRASALAACKLAKYKRLCRQKEG